MSWFLEHVSSFMAPLAGGLSFLTAYIAFSARRNHRAGRKPLSEGLRAVLILVIVVASVVFGMALARYHG